MNDKNANRVKLTDECNDKLHFKLLPKTKSREEGSDIGFGENIQIYSKEIDRFLNLS